MRNVNRRGKADAKSTDNDADVESQTTNQTPRTSPATAPGTSPVVVLLRKVMLLNSQDAGGIYLRQIIKDIISGTILGVVFLMFLIFLDYQNIIQLGSARAFRRAAFELMTDPETVKSIEDSTDMKFVPLEVFQSIHDEIARNEDKVKDTQGQDDHQKDYDSKKEELDAMKKEYEELKAKANTVLGLDKWCGHCKAGWGGCDQRIRYLMDTYHSQEITTKLEIMETGKCLLP